MKKGSLLYHILFWAGIYILWVLVFQRYSVSLTKTITIEFCYLIFITSDYYAISNFIIPRFLHRRKYALFVSFTLLVIMFSSLLRAMVAVQMNRHYFHTTNPTDFGTLYLNSAVNISLWVLLITMGKMLIDRMRTQEQLDGLDKERVKNELDYLKAQINPHALFNSLNTIYGHIDKGNQVARNILLQFSELLRYQLYDCGVEKVCLEKELDYIKNYVAFQRLRKDEKLRVSLQIDEIEAGLEIAPLMLVVLIENAFKFVSNYGDRENMICIRISTRNKVLQSSFINTKETLHNSIQTHSKGIGLANLKRRLELLYSDKYNLVTRVENDKYETNLTIDLS